MRPSTPAAWPASPYALTRSARQSARLVGVIALSVYVATAGGGLTSTDGVMTYEVTRNMVWHGSVAASYNVFGFEPHRGVDGRYYSPFGIGQSVFNIPFYLVGRAAVAGGLRLGRPETVEKAAVAMGSTVSAALVVWLAFLFSWRLSGHRGAALWTSLTLAFGTLIWPYSKFGFNASLTGCCLLAGIYAVWLGVRSGRAGPVAWAGLWLGFAFLTRHEMVVAALVTAGWIAIELRRDPRRLATRLGQMLMPFAACLALWLWYNASRFGNPLNTGNMGDPVLQFDASLWTGLYGLLASPGRSLFLYVPVAAAGAVALGHWARRDSAAWLFAAVIGSLTLVYASLPYWEGSRGYGPRYLVPLVPLLIVPLVWSFLPARPERRFLQALAVLSALVQMPGVVVDFSRVSVKHARAAGGFSREASLYTFQASGLAINAKAMTSAVPENVQYLISQTRPVPHPPSPNDADWAQRFAFSLDFWWLYLYYLGALPNWAAIALGVILLVPATAAAARLWRLPSG